MSDDFILNKFFSEIYHVDDTPVSDASMRAGMVEQQFTLFVDMLRKTMPVQELRELGSLIWDLVGNRVCPTAMAPVASLHFWCEMRGNIQNLKALAVILCPDNWCKMVRQDKWMQFGGIIHCGSKARDYWNLKIDQDSNSRALAYEAEFLHFAKSFPEFSPNEYQQQVMKMMPNGLADAKGMYKSRQYDGVGPPYPVNLEELCNKLQSAPESQNKFRGFRR
jgi:hypothetical protein